MNTQRILLVTIVVVFLYVVWNINKTMDRNIEMISHHAINSQTSLDSSEHNINNNDIKELSREEKSIQNPLYNSRVNKKNESHYKQTPYELYMGKHQYLKDKSFLYTDRMNEHSNTKTDYDLVTDPIDMIEAKEPKGILDSLADEFDGTLDRNFVNSRILQNPHDNSNCALPDKVSEQCINKMMQENGCYKCSANSCKLPKSVSENCYSRRVVG